MQPNEESDFVSVRIAEKLRNLALSSSESFIFKVHKQLRGINEKAYEPEIIAIGPYHRGKQNLQMMEEHKLRYLEQLLKRKVENNADKYILVLRSLELEARRCYAESINLSKDEFIEMLLLDGCFVVEIIRKFEMAYLRNKNDPIFQMDWIVISLQRDLMLFENQLPLSILCKLFDLIEVPDNHNRFMHLALCFFRDLLPGNGYRDHVDANSNLNIKHLLGLIHNNWLPKVSENGPNTMTWHFVPSVTELLEAGVEIKKAKKGSLFDITFKNGIIRIPSLRIEDRTETFLRNLGAYEQYYPDIQISYITDYMRCIDCLINTPNDVEILCRCGIIDNWLGDKEVISDIFNKISDAVAGPGPNFQYADMFNKINLHCGKHKNRLLAKLRRDYFNGPWATISVLAAFVLLVLTFTQTFFTIFPR